MAVEPKPAPRIEPMAPNPSGAPKKTLAGVMGVAAAGLFVAGLNAWEGNESVGYRDVVGVATACRGVTGPVVVVGKHYSAAQCEAMNERGAIAHIEPVLACVPQLRGRPNQLAAAGMLAYNVGTRGFCNSTAARRFRAGDWRGGCDAFLAWNKAGGRVVRGLVNRRNYERALCLRGL